MLLEQLLLQSSLDQLDFLYFYLNLPLIELDLVE
jgi:hypothetical protein